MSWSVYFTIFVQVVLAVLMLPTAVVLSIALVVDISEVIAKYEKRWLGKDAENEKN